MDSREQRSLTGEAGPHADLTWSVIHAGIEAQKRLGSWLFESACAACLAYELGRSGHTVERQVPVPTRYRDLEVPHASRLDLLIDGLLAGEPKVAVAITKEHEVQVLSYLRYSGKPMGLLMNFALQPPAKRGIRRFLLSSLPSAASSV